MPCQGPFHFSYSVDDFCPLPDPDVGLSIFVCDVEHTSFHFGLRGRKFVLYLFGQCPGFCTICHSSTSVTEYPKVFRNWWGQTENQRGRLIDFFSMLIGHVRWIGLLANVWCSNHSEFSGQTYATRYFTLKLLLVIQRRARR